MASFLVQIVRTDTDAYTELPDVHLTLGLATDRCESVNRRWRDLDPKRQWFDYAMVRRQPEGGSHA